MEYDLDLQSLQEMRNAVKQAKKAQVSYAKFSQKQVDAVVESVANAAFLHSLELAKLAVVETRMGVVEHKKMKNEVASQAVYESIKNEKTVGIIQEDKTQKLIEIADPFGVVAGIIPTTNPTSTAIFKALIALKTKNALVISPHPRAVKCTVAALKICVEAAEAAGAPEGIIGWITIPSMIATEQLMKHKDVDLILATGGKGLVRAAYSSGKPAYGVGPGNVPVYIEKTANVEVAVKKIVDSKTFDNGTICATEQAIVTDKNIQQIVIRELKKNGAYIVNQEEKKLLEQVISPTPGLLNPDIVGQSAIQIAELAGFHVPHTTRLLVAEEEKIGKQVPLSIEKLSPIFALYTVNSYEEAKSYCLSLLDLGGRGHSLALHTNDDRIARDMAIELPVSRIMVNTLSSIGAVGATTALKPSFTLGCGSFGGNITSDNVSAKHLLNIKRLAYGVKEVELHHHSQIHEDNSLETESTNGVDAIVGKVLNELNCNEELDLSVVRDLVKQILDKYQTNY